MSIPTLGWRHRYPPLPLDISKAGSTISCRGTTPLRCHRSAYDLSRSGAKGLSCSRHCCINALAMTGSAIGQQEELRFYGCCRNGAARHPRADCYMAETAGPLGWSLPHVSQMLGRYAAIDSGQSNRLPEKIFTVEAKPAATLKASLADNRTGAPLDEHARLKTRIYK